MNYIKDLFSNIVHKKVEIKTKELGSGTSTIYKGIVVGCYSTGETFIVLDTNELISIKYIEMIKIVD